MEQVRLVPVVALMGGLLSAAAGCGNAPPSRATAQDGGPAGSSPGVLTVANAASLPACDAANADEFSYITFTQTEVVCHNGVWVPVTQATSAGLCGSGVGGVIDITLPPYSVTPGSGDAYPAIQAAVNCVCGANTFPTQPILLPQGMLSLSQPLIITCGAELVGASRSGSILSPAFNGPAILMEPADASVPVGPDLLSDAGDAGNSLALFTFSQPQPSPYIDYTVFDLRDVPGGELNGLATFTAEAFVDLVSPRPGASDVADAYETFLVSSAWQGSGVPDGGKAILPGYTSAFGLGIWNLDSNPDAGLSTQNQIYALLTTSGPADAGATAAPVTTRLGPTPYLSQGVHHVALTYDGKTANLFVDGTLQVSKPASGTIVQRANEEVHLGTDAFNASMTGLVDSVRLSNTVRYAAESDGGPSFAVPTSKFEPDTGTLVLANFDTQMAGMTQVWSGTKPYWIPIRGAVDSTGATIPSGYGGANLHNFTVNGGMGIFGNLADYTTLSQLDCLNCDYGFALTGNGGISQFADVTATAGTSRGRYGIYIDQAGQTEFHDITLNGQVLPLVMTNGQENVLTNIDITPGQNTVFGMLMEYADPLIDGVTIGPGGSQYLAGIVLSRGLARGMVLNGHIDGNGSNPIYPIFVDNWGALPSPGPSALVQNTTFVNTAADPYILFMNSAPTPTAPNMMLGVTVDSSATLSNDPNLITMPNPITPPAPSVVPPSDPGTATVTSGTPASNVFDVNTYGARACLQSSCFDTGARYDSYQGIQGAVNAACEAGASTVFFPVGVYFTTQPVQVNCNLEIDGASESATYVGEGQTSETGPVFVMNPAGMTGIDPGAALVGTGHSMNTDDGTYWINLRDSPSLEVNGLGAFTVEAFVEMTKPSSGYGGIVQSHGCLGTSPALPGCTSAFELGTMNQNLYGSMTVGGTTYALDGPSLTLNTPHHVALTYDGSSTISLLADGQVVACAAASGTVGQQQSEDVTVGAQTNGFDGAVQSPAISGFIDSVRVSQRDEYATELDAGAGACVIGASYMAPTNKLLSETGETLVLLNFDGNVGLVTRADWTLATGSDGYYFPVRRTTEPSGSSDSTVNVTLKNMYLAYGGVFGANVVNSKFINIAEYSDNGIQLTGQSSGSLFDGVGADGDGRGRYGLLAVNGSNNVYHQVVSYYNELPLVVYGGSQVQLDDLTLNPAQTSAYAAYFIHSDDTARALYSYLYSYKAGEFPAWQGNVIVDHPTAPFQLYASELDEPSSGAVAPLTIDGGKGYVLEAVTFAWFSNVATAGIVHITTAPDPGSPQVAIGLNYATGTTVNIPTIGSQAGGLPP